MNFSLIFSLSALLYVLLFSGITLLLAMRHGWIMGVVRAGTSLVTAIISVPLAKLIAGKVASALAGEILSMLGASVADLLNSVPVAQEGAEVLVTLILAPIFFLFVFIILRGFLGIVLKILEKTVPFFKKQEKGPKKITLPVGAANGFIMALATLIPICGFLALGGAALDTLVQPDMVNTEFVQQTVITGTKTSEAELKDLADDLGHNPAVVVVHGTVGKPMFKWMTTDKLDTTKTHGQTVKMNLESELCSLLEVAGHATEMMDIASRTEHHEGDRERLVGLADTLLDNTWVKLVATDFIVELSTSWQANKAFAGIKPPSMDPTLKPTYDAFLKVLAAETYDTIEEDLHVIVDVTGEILMADLFNNNGTYNDMVKKLGQTTLLTDITAKLQANVRLAPIAQELKALSMRLVTKMLGVDELKSGKHDALVGDVANTLSGVIDMPEEERKVVIMDTIRESFGNSGYEVPEDIAVEISNQIIDELGTDGEITKDELKDYMIEHADDQELLDKIEDSVGSDKFDADKFDPDTVDPDLLDPDLIGGNPGLNGTETN